MRPASLQATILIKQVSLQVLAKLNLPSLAQRDNKKLVTFHKIIN